MSSQRKILSCRTNGAKNRGAKTPEARLRSAANNLKHGLLARTVVLEDEDLQSFTNFANAVERDLNPQNEVESDLVAKIAVSRWRLLRTWTMERSTLNAAIEKQDHPAACARTALAFRALSDESRILDLLNRYEARFDRQFGRALTTLLDLRPGRQAPPPSSLTQNEFCRSKPIPNSNT